MCDETVVYNASCSNKTLQENIVFSDNKTLTFLKQNDCCNI
jgi:hypothetical protein